MLSPFLTASRKLVIKLLSLSNPEEVIQKSTSFWASMLGLKGAVSQSFNLCKLIHSAVSGLSTSYELGKLSGIIIGNSVAATSSILLYSFPFPFMIKSISNSFAILYTRL